MPAMPRSFQQGSFTGGGRGYTGYDLYDTEPDNIRVRGQVERSLLLPQLDAQMRQAQLGADTARFQTQAGADTQRFGIETDSDTARRGQDFSFAATTQGNQLAADTARRGQDISLQASLAPIQQRDRRWQDVFPLINAQLGQAGSPDVVGGTPRPQPAVTTGGVWSPQQVEEQANAAQAKIGQQAASRVNQTRQDLAGRGFGTRSPLQMALETAIGGQATAAQADAGRGIRWDAAQGNADARLQQERLQQQQWAELEDSDIRRRQANTQRTSQLLSALAAFA